MIHFIYHSQELLLHIVDTLAIRTSLYFLSGLVKQLPFKDRFLTEPAEYGMLLLETLVYLLLAKLPFTVTINKLLLRPKPLMTLALLNLFAFPVTLPLI